MIQNKFPFKLTYQELHNFNQAITQTIAEVKKCDIWEGLLLLILDDIRVKASRKLINPFITTNFTLNRKEATALLLMYEVDPAYLNHTGFDVIFKINNTNHKHLHM